MVGFYFYSQRDDAAFDEKTRSTIKLNNGTILYLREVNKYLALVCILREDSFEKQGTEIKSIVQSSQKLKLAGQ
jgi:hypothetical protein